MKLYIPRFRNRRFHQDMASQACATIAEQGSSSAIVELCKELASGAKPIASLLTWGTLSSVSAYVLLLGGAQFLHWKAKRRSDREMRKHFAEVGAAIEKIDDDQKQAVKMLSKIHSRSRFVWAKIDAKEKDLIAKRTVKLLEPLLAELKLESKVDLYDLWLVNSDTNNRIRDLEKVPEVLQKQDERLSEILTAVTGSSEAIGRGDRRNLPRREAVHYAEDVKGRLQFEQRITELFEEAARVGDPLINATKFPPMPSRPFHVQVKRQFEKNPSRRPRKKTLELLKRRLRATRKLVEQGRILFILEEDGHEDYFMRAQEDRRSYSPAIRRALGDQLLWSKQLIQKLKPRVLRVHFELQATVFVTPYAGVLYFNRIPTKNLQFGPRGRELGAEEARSLYELLKNIADQEDDYDARQIVVDWLDELQQKNEV